MKYTGELNDKMKGFYRSKYTTPSGEERYCAVTQFEVGNYCALLLFNISSTSQLQIRIYFFQAADARRAFPCWDEPAIKATFDITMIVPKDKVTLSNMVWLH
jgi:puromycin-sensitive aminopeptidase